MPPHAMVVLFVLLVGVGPMLGAAGSIPGDAPIRGQLLQRWLKDPVARRELIDRWRSRSSPLAAAFAALNVSDPDIVSDSAVDGRRLPFISIGCLFDVYKLVNTNALWAFSMLDASVKIPVGLLAGSLKHMGNWDECVNQRDIPSIYASRTFNGQMCLVNLKPELVSLRTAEFHHETRANIPGLSPLLTAMQVTMGVCVPDTCSVNDVQNIFSVFLRNLKVVDGIQLVPSVADRDCSTRDGPQLESGDVVAVMVLSILAALVVLSTVYDAVTPAEERRELPAAFSLISNGRKLLELPKADADHTLSCLHGLRFLSMCWVVLGHRYPTPFLLPIINPSFIIYVLQDFFHLFLVNASLSVDTFFVLSGLLLGYLFFKQDISKQRLNVPMFYLHRYIRLTPALAMIALLEATLVFHAGWGPLWHSVLDDSHESCQRNWWNTFLYVGNYVRPLEDVCVSQGWYLMVDMQLHWLSPLVILPLAHKPKLGLVWLLFLSVGGTISNFIILFFGDESYNEDISEYVEYSMKNFEYFTHTRFVPYLIGLAMGYLLAIRYRSGELKKPMPFIASIAGWLISAGLMLAALFGYNIFLKPPYPTQLESTFYNSLKRPTWSLGLVMVVYLCASGNGGGANTFLSWWGFHILGRLSYGVYLVHLSVQRIQIGSFITQYYTKDVELFVMFCGDLVISLLFAVVLSLVCESPFIVLEKQLLGIGRRNKARTQPISVPDTHSLAATDSAATPTVSIDALTSSKTSEPHSAHSDFVSEEPTGEHPSETSYVQAKSSWLDSSADLRHKNVRKPSTLSDYEHFQTAD